MARKKTSTVSLDPTLTLSGLTQKYIEHLEADGKSIGTAFSYRMEMRLAEGELGSDTLVASLTADDVARFNRSKRVNRLKSGKVKSPLSVAKSQRVLRLALNWAAQSGLIASSPIPAKGEPTVAEVETAAPAKKPRKARVVVDEPVAEPDATPTADADTNAPVEATAA